ncbi:MAG: gas vesicle protein K [Acidobacteria bacterium]|nr:gas vesicle protein K [Acidobacteriota bacterium]MBI3654835.1 gas vesicle protein K [Acidobacteriota bacterium]
MRLDIHEDNLKHGLLGLVLALVEIIRDTLKIEAVKRIDGGRLSEAEIERLGEALLDLDSALEEIKQEQGICQAVRTVRQGLDSIVSDVVEKILSPEPTEYRPSLNASARSNL